MADDTNDFTVDTLGNRLQISAAVVGTNLTINGTYTPVGQADIVFSLASTALPAADTVQTKYVSAQINSSGTVTLFNNLGSKPALQAGQLLEVWALAIPANATTDDGLAEITPDLQ